MQKVVFNRIIPTSYGHLFKKKLIKVKKNKPREQNNKMEDKGIKKEFKPSSYVSH